MPHAFDLHPCGACHRVRHAAICNSRRLLLIEIMSMMAYDKVREADMKLGVSVSRPPMFQALSSEHQDLAHRQVCGSPWCRGNPCHVVRSLHHLQEPVKFPGWIGDAVDGPGQLRTDQPQSQRTQLLLQSSGRAVILLDCRKVSS